jgi:hypothetical protein
MRFHDVEQNTEEWFNLRLGKATASNFACFMANDGKAFGEPAKEYALQLALEIATGRRAEFGFKNADTERGQEQEPVARMLYEERTFTDVANGGFFCWGRWGDSPDGLPGDGTLEIKCVVAKTHFATLRRGTFDPAYRWQLVGHLDCTGRDWVDFASYCSDFPEEQQLVVYRLTRKECADEIKRLQERRAQFIELVDSTLSQLRSAA